MPRKKKNQETISSEIPSENELKNFVDSSEKILTTNYFVFCLIMLFILLTSIFFYINTKNTKLVTQEFSVVQNMEEQNLSKQKNTLDGIEKIILKLDSSKDNISVLNMKLEIFENKLKKLNNVSSKLDTLLLNYKTYKVELNEKQN